MHGRGAAAAVGGRPVGRVASSAGAVCHRGLHVTDDLEQRGEEGVEEEEEEGLSREERGRGQREGERQCSLAKCFWLI